LRSKTIEARKGHSLFSYHYKTFNGKCSDPSEFKKLCAENFRTACFTEVPLKELNHLTKKRPYGNVKLSNYGIVFRRSFVLRKGGGPAIYTNGLRADSLSETLKEKFSSELSGIARKCKKHWGDEIRNLAKFWGLFNTMKYTYDFTWEREWRYIGNFEFELEDVVAIVAQNKNEFLNELKIQDNTLHDEIFNLRIPIVNPTRSDSLKKWDSSQMTS
jgi:hypothetical protein